MLRSDPYVDQQPVASIHHEETKSTVLVKSFLQSCLKLMRDERALREMQSLTDKCEHPVSQDAANIAIHQIKKYIWTGKEMRLSAQIGEYDMDEVILDLGSEVNVLTK